MKSLQELLPSAEKFPPKKIVVAAAADLPVLKAIEQAFLLNLVEPILVGNKNAIESICSENQINCGTFEIIDESDSEKASFIAVKLIKEGYAKILMKGLLPTALLLKAVVSKDRGIRESRTLSHLALFESKFYPKLLGVTDAAMNIAPNFEEKIEIIRNAVKILHKIGYDNPKVAMLAPLETVNEKIASTVDAGNIKKMNVQGILSGCTVDGPMALDNAVSKEAAHHKGITGSVAGDADLLVVPDLNSGNILYKSLIFLGGATAAAIIAGASAPIVLTSRADSEDSKLLSIALAAKIYNNPQQ